MTQWIAENWPYLVGGGGSLVVGLLIWSCLRAASRADDATALAESVDRRLREVVQEQYDQRRRAERLRANLSVRQTLAKDVHVEDGHE